MPVWCLCTYTIHTYNSSLYNHCLKCSRRIIVSYLANEYWNINYVHSQTNFLFCLCHSPSRLHYLYLPLTLSLFRIVHSFLSHLFSLPLSMSVKGAILAAGILDAGGRNVVVSMQSRAGFMKMGWVRLVIRTGSSRREIMTLISVEIRINIRRRKTWSVFLFSS